MLTLRARQFSKIKGKNQYIRRKGSVESKERFRIIKGINGFSLEVGFGFGVSISFSVGFTIRMATLPLGGVGGGWRGLNIQNIIHKHHHISNCH